MNHHPLTDPTSLIAYRLANRESSNTGKRRAPGGANPIGAVFAAVLGLGLLVVAISVLVCI